MGQKIRGYQPIIVDGNAGIRIIIDKDAIKNSPLKKADILPYIQEFTQNQLNDITNDLNLDANTYISEIELEKLVNNWKKDKQGGGFKNNFSDDSSTTSEGGGRPNIYNYAEQLTKFFSKILQRESMMNQ